jgi:hypothetical protein
VKPGEDCEEMRVSGKASEEDQCDSRLEDDKVSLNEPLSIKTSSQSPVVSLVSSRSRALAPPYMRMDAGGKT